MDEMRKALETIVKDTEGKIYTLRIEDKEKVDNE